MSALTSEKKAAPIGSVAPSRILRSRIAREATRLIARIVKPAVFIAAGSRWFPLFGVIVHRGRRSGREYRTPVVMLPYQGGIVIPLTFGDDAGWFQNVVVAGECAVRWRGGERRLQTAPVVDADAVKAGLSAVLRGLLAVAGIGHFLPLEPIA